MSRIWIAILAALFLSIGLFGGVAGGRTVQAAEVKAAVEAGEPANFDGCTIVGNLDLSSIEIKGPVYFSNAVFQNRTSFYQTTFKDNANFWGAAFEDYANFGNSEFNGLAGFMQTQFKRDAYFGGATFNNSAYFRDAEFNYNAGFGSAVFYGLADFLGTRFNYTAGFRSAEFNDLADFRDSILRGDANFQDADFNNSAHFRDVNFIGTSNFLGAEFKQGIGFEDANFNGDANFRGAGFNGAANFESAEFNGLADFQNATFNISDFTEAQFNKEAHFDALFKGKATFNKTRFNEDALFENAKFQDELSLTRTSYNKLFIRWHNIKLERLVYDDTAYINLMKNFKNLGYYEDYDNCYFNYRKERRAQDWPGLTDWDEEARKSIDHPLEWFYGYGTKPFNAFFISLGIIIAFALFWRVLGLGGPKDKTAACLKDGDEWLDGDLIDILGFSATVFLSGTRFFIDPPAIPKIEGRSRSMIKIAFIVERVLGALFSVLFFIAISGTIVRAS